MEGGREGREKECVCEIGKEGGEGGRRERVWNREGKGGRERDGNGEESTEGRGEWRVCEKWTEEEERVRERRRERERLGREGKRGK